MKTMKIRIVHTLFVLSLLTLCACNEGKKTNQGQQGEPQSENRTEEAETETKTTIEVGKEFQQVNNISSLDIKWREGPCSVTFVGNPLLANHFDFQYDDAGLTILQKTEDTQLPARLVITSPTLTILSNYNEAAIHLCGILTAQQLTLGNQGGGSIEADTIRCEQFKYSSAAASTAKFALIDADDALILADGTGTTDLNLDVRHLNLQAWGTQTITLDGHADTREISVSRTNMVNNRLQ